MNFMNRTICKLFSIGLAVVIFFLFSSNTFAQNRSISGILSLPNSVTADEDIGINLSVTNVDADGFVLDELGAEFLTIEDGQSHVDYQINIADPTFISDLVMVRIMCFLNCDFADGDMQTSFFLQNDGSFAREENSLPLDKLASSLNFQFPAIPRRTINGSLTLPDSFGGSGNVGVSITLAEIDESGFALATLASDSIPVHSSDRQSNFELTFIVPEPGARISLSIRCETKCREIDDRTSTSFFLQADGTFDDLSSNISLSQLPNVIDFRFPELVIQTITGVISLPNGVIADSSIFLAVALTNAEILNPFRNTVDQVSTLIESGTSSTRYSLSFREPNSSTPLELTIRCTVFCDDADGDTLKTFFLQSDGSFAVDSNQFSAADLDIEEVIDFQFPAFNFFEIEDILPSIIFLLSSEEN